jgi:hypothetical protein
MAGRNTSKSFHPSKMGHMVPPILVNERDWQALEEMACCQFSPEQREAIADELAVCRDYRDYQAEQVTRQDVKRTLTAISGMQGMEIIEAYNNCDQITDVLIYEAAWFQFGVNVLTCNDTDKACETIAKAAAYALDNLPESKGGRPPKDHHKRLARFCCELWAQTGNSHSANTWNGNSTPMVEFAQYLFDLVDDHLTDPGTIAERLNEAR